MADWGSIAVKGLTTKTNNGLTVPQYLRRIVCANQNFSLGGKTILQGNPTQPALELTTQGYWRFRWSVLSGYRYITIDVKQEENQAPRPTLVVKANPSIGVLDDVVEEAPSGTGWVTIGPAVITPSDSGAVWVELYANYDAPSVSYWDNIQTS